MGDGSGTLEKVPEIGTFLPSAPVADPITIYVCPNRSGWPTVQVLRSAETAPDTGLPSAPVIVTATSEPPATFTVTGWLGDRSVVPNAGDAVTTTTAGVRASSA